MIKKVFLIALALLLLAAVGIQFVPVDRSNPPTTELIAAPDPVMAILRRSCFDCHSNETKWPWYAYVAPVSWLVAEDVEHGRQHLNFSEWDLLDADRRIHTIEETYEEAQRGLMPLDKYIRMHPEAALSQADLQILSDWAEAVRTEADMGGWLDALDPPGHPPGSDQSDEPESEDHD